MIYLLLVLLVLAVGFLSLKTVQPRETRLVLSKVIGRPADSVFDVIGALEQAPVWRRRPSWMPRFFRMPDLSRWGEHIAANERLSHRSKSKSEEIHIRHIANREFTYRSILPHDLSYQSTFQVSPQDGVCRLSWEIRFQVCRLPDRIRLTAIADSVRESMARSLDYIQRLALVSPGQISLHRPIDEHVYVTSRDEVPAA